jgi:hypothetical protein
MSRLGPPRPLGPKARRTHLPASPRLGFWCSPRPLVPPGVRGAFVFRTAFILGADHGRTGKRRIVPHDITA